MEGLRHNKQLVGERFWAHGTLSLLCEHQCHSFLVIERHVKIIMRWTEATLHCFWYDESPGSLNRWPPGQLNVVQLRTR